MNITKLQLENYRCYQNLTAEFKSGINLFVGKNGGGKTALLEALVVAVGGIFHSLPAKMQPKVIIDKGDIYVSPLKNVASSADTSTVWAESKGIEGAWWRTIKRETGTNDYKHLSSAKEYGEKLFQQLRDDPQGNAIIAPLLAYYSTLRLHKDARQTANQNFDPFIGRLNGYLQCLEAKAIKTILDDWLAKAAATRNEKKLKGIPHEDRALENIEEAIKITAIKFLGFPADAPITIYQDSQLGEPVLYCEGIADLPLSFYSDGTRNLLYLIIDLIWRASQLNPQLPLKDFDQLNGVVIIDEVDLHLHPTWQGQAIEWLLSFFPKVQFFITTHSPVTVANFNRRKNKEGKFIDALYILGNSSEKNIEVAPVGENIHFFGSEVNSVLVDVLGSSPRNKETQKEIDKLWTMIEAKEDYNTLLQKLRQQLGDSDSAIVYAQTLIDWQNMDNL